MNMQFRLEVHVVDDDQNVRNALQTALSLEGFDVRVYDNANSFMQASSNRSASVILLDVNIPDRSGMEVLKELRGQANCPPILMMSSDADIPLAVEAIKLGATDFIEKPFDLDHVLGKVQAAIGARHVIAPLTGALSVLSRREIEVINVIAKGASSKEAGNRLNISPRTVDAHRARIIDKLGVRNTAELMTLYFSAQNRG